MARTREMIEYERKIQERIAGAMVDELQRATELFGTIASDHEGYAIIKEELDELWDAIRKKDPDHKRKSANIWKEAIQIGAMAIRFVFDQYHDAYLELVREEERKVDDEGSAEV